ncbi:unnamed protein product, partial [Vitis vinifera]
MRLWTPTVIGLSSKSISFAFIRLLQISSFRYSSPTSSRVLPLSSEISKALEVYEKMNGSNVLTYNTMISAACMHSQEEDALKLLLKMEESSCKPDLNTYSPLLKMCCRNNRMKVLSALLNHMFKNDTSLEAGTYSLLVHGLCKSGKLEHACLFFEEMVFRMHPLIHHFSLLFFFLGMGHFV